MMDAERPRGFKSRRSPQGMAIALCKGCNEGLYPLERSRRASRKAAARGVAPLGKGEGHSRRGAPCAQPLANSLQPSLLPGQGTSRAVRFQQPVSQRQSMTRLLPLQLWLYFTMINASP